MLELEYRHRRFGIRKKDEKFRYLKRENSTLPIR